MYGHRRKKVDEKSCVTPAGTWNELDFQNEWEENEQNGQKLFMVLNGFPNVIVAQGQQYNTREKPTVVVYTYIDHRGGTQKHNQGTP